MEQERLEQLYRRIQEQRNPDKPALIDVSPIDQLGGFQPLAGLCHWNAVRYTQLNPSCSVVRGWVVPHIGAQDLDKHSVIKKADGRLVCVTLGLSKVSKVEFIEHDPMWCDVPFADLPCKLLGMTQ